MANTTAISAQFKLDTMLALLPANISTLKAALYLTTGNIGASTTTYTTSAEVSGTGYTAGGVAVAAATAPALSGTTAFWTPSAPIVYTGVTLTTAFDTVMIYDTARSNKMIGSWNFGPQTVTAGTLTLTMPANDAANALIRA